jgi:acyl carrier protein
MNPAEIHHALTTELTAALGIDPGDIRPESLLVADLGAESIDLIDLTFRIEKTFNIQIPEGELFEDSRHPARDLTVADVVAYIAKRMTLPPS